VVQGSPARYLCKRLGFAESSRFAYLYSVIEPIARRILAALAQRPGLVAGLTLALALPVLLLNLGQMPLLVDEPIRALVALEMHYSGHFFQPTLQGLPYYNKPPLFNWLLIVLFRLTGRQDEFVLRLPTVVALLLYSAAIWRVLRPQLGSKVAFTVALAFATSGRILFYDSFFGLIDLWHAGLTWLGFMAIWHYGGRGQWLRLFVITYLLTAVGFLLKGLPSIVFQGIALLVYCLDTRQWRRLFSWQHVLGGLVLLAVLGTYFLIYSRHNSLDIALKTLWSQSSQRTVAAQPLADSVRYVLLFPFDFIKHFLPWTLLVVCLLRPALRAAVWQQPFLRYNALLFGAVLPVYWLSPATIPRYLFMLVPLLLAVLVPLYYQLQAARAWPARWLDALLLALLLASSLLVLGAPLIHIMPAATGVAVSMARVVAGAWAWSLGLFALLALLAYLFWKLLDYRLLLLGYFLLVLRLAFDVFVFPARLQTSPEVAYRTTGIRVGRETRGRPLVLLPHSHLDDVEAFYITRERGQTLLTDSLPGRPGCLYLGQAAQLAGQPCRTLDEFVIDGGLRFRLVKFAEK
jgi:4-amino-4-deoxy-L-arabinose transferase-like glycosyltransferase